MGLLRRYILRELFYWFGLILLVFTAIVVAKELNDIRDELLDEDAKTPVFVVLQYMALRIPGVLAEAIPLVAMFSVLFGIGMMAKNREIIAMISTGVSFAYLAGPVLVFGAAVTLGALALAQYIVPASESQARYLYKVVMKGENPLVFFSNDGIFRKGPGRRFYVVANFNSETDEMTRPSIIDVNDRGDGIAQRIEAKRARLVQPSGGEGGFWEFEGAEQWVFNEDGSSVTAKRFAKEDPFRDPLEEKLDSLLTREKSPVELSLTDLHVHSAALKRQGDGPQIAKYETNFQSRLALPFSCLLLALVAFGIAADVQRRRFVLVFTAGLGLGVAYYVLHESIKGLGASGSLSGIFGSFGPVAAGWGAAAIYAALAAWLIRRLSTVH